MCLIIHNKTAGLRVSKSRIMDIMLILDGKHNTRGWRCVGEYSMGCSCYQGVWAFAYCTHINEQCVWLDSVSTGYGRKSPLVMFGESFLNNSNHSSWWHVGRAYPPRTRPLKLGNNVCVLVVRYKGIRVTSDS